MNSKQVEEYASALHEAPIAADEFEVHFGSFQQEQQGVYSAAAHKVARASVVDEGAGDLAACLKLEGAKLFRQNQARCAEEMEKEQADTAERRLVGPQFASLAEAVLGGSVLGVRFHLIDQKADGSAPDQEGNTPLHLACRGAHTEVVRCLLRHIADCNALDARGRAAVTCPSDQCRGVLCALLAPTSLPTSLFQRSSIFSACASSQVHLCALSGAGGACHALVIGGANKALRDADGRTAASIAADVGHTEVAAMCHGGVARPSRQAAQEYQETVEQFLRDTLGDGGSVQAQRKEQIRELAQRQETLRAEEESAVEEKRYDDADRLSQQLTAASDKILHTRRFVARPASSWDFGIGAGWMQFVRRSAERQICNRPRSSRPHETSS